MSCLFGMMGRIDKPLDKITKRKGEKSQINKIRDQKGETAAGTEETQIIVRTCSKSSVPLNQKT